MHGNPAFVKLSKSNLLFSKWTGNFSMWYIPGINELSIPASLLRRIDLKLHIKGTTSENQLKVPL